SKAFVAGVAKGEGSLASPQGEAPRRARGTARAAQAIRRKSFRTSPSRIVAQANLSGPGAYDIELVGESHYQEALEQICGDFNQVNSPASRHHTPLLQAGVADALLIRRQRDAKDFITVCDGIIAEWGRRAR